MTKHDTHTNHAHSHPKQDKHDCHDEHDHGNPFLVPFVLILLFSFVEFFGGIWTQSLALLGDAWHMFSDVLALGVAMVAASAKFKGHRTAELYASIVNAVLMLVVIVWITVEAVDRLQQPHAVAGDYVMLIAFIGLVVNLIVAQRLHHLAEHHDGHNSLNQRAALLHVIGDVLGSVAAIVAGAVIHFTGWVAIDPILSILISLVLLVGTYRLIQDIRKVMRGETVSHHGHSH